jgi:hypothetical protein
LGAVLVPHSGQNLEPAGIAVEQVEHFTVGGAGTLAPRFGRRRNRTIAMIQTPTTKRTQVANPMTPKIKISERKPPNPERRLENGLVELFPPLPPSFDEVTSTLTVLLTVWLLWESDTFTKTPKLPVEEGSQEKLGPLWPPQPEGNAK